MLELIQKNAPIKGIKAPIIESLLESDFIARGSNIIVTIPMIQNPWPIKSYLLNLAYVSTENMIIKMPVALFVICAWDVTVIDHPRTSPVAQINPRKDLRAILTSISIVVSCQKLIVASFLMYINADMSIDIINPPWVRQTSLTRGDSGGKLIVNGPFQAPGISIKIKSSTPTIKLNSTSAS